MQRTLIIQRLAALVRQEADNEARGRIKARMMACARKVIEDSAAEAHKWLKKLENPQMTQTERVGDKVRYNPVELLADRAKQWKKLWMNGANKTGEISSSLRRIRQMAIKEAEKRMLVEPEDVRRACKKAGQCQKFGH